jgi:hypothetical protein
LRQALDAVKARRREDWDRLAWGLLWVVNRMPNFGKRPRPPVRFHQLNPMTRLYAAGRRSGLSDDALELALDRMTEMNQ